MSNQPDTIQVNKKSWVKRTLDDGSGWFYEHAGAFGELIVEEGRDGSFFAFWWPPKVKSGDAVELGRGYKSLRSAMKAAHTYIERLKGLLAQAD